MNVSNPGLCGKTIFQRRRKAYCWSIVNRPQQTTLHSKLEYNKKYWISLARVTVSVLLLSIVMVYNAKPLLRFAVKY